jgi:PAS domain S-box-containing protein
MSKDWALTGNERRFEQDELIVSKTDPKGRITYANRVFQRVSLYSESELLGKAHNIVRHPDMPRCVFRFIWDRLQAGHEVFGYVLNRCKNGDHYWVFAHMTPTFDGRRRITGYHSSRRVPSLAALAEVRALYADLLAIERRHRLPGEQWEASLPEFHARLASLGLTYDEWIFRLCAQRSTEEPTCPSPTRPAPPPPPQPIGATTGAGSPTPLASASGRPAAISRPASSTSTTPPRPRPCSTR